MERPVLMCLLTRGGECMSSACVYAGNLCRHSAYFYRHLEVHDFITPIIKCCSDSDSATRKFACFAYGNAAFHDGTLYKKLAAGIPSLVAALYDRETKTRVNAAGALGNLARNGDQVVAQMIHAGAVKVSEAIFCTPITATKALHDSMSSLYSSCALASQEMVEVATVNNQEPGLQSVALFSLGNMANFPAMCAEMHDVECRARLGPLLNSGSQEVRRNCERLVNKLDLHPPRRLASAVGGRAHQF
jgi:hypothetical protein